MDLANDQAISVTHEIDRLLEWGALVAAQLRSNLVCMRKHREALISSGELPARINQIRSWRESNVFSIKERTVLGLSEAISDDRCHDISPILCEARRHLNTDEIVRLSANVMAVNEWMEMHHAPVVRVLVVEDNADDQLLLNRQLQKTCFKDHVLFLSDPRVALDLMQGFGSHIFRQNLLTIFLDVHLPHISGINVLRDIRAIEGWADFPVVVMTNDTNPQILNECTELNATAFVQKPVTMADFTKAIARLFHRPRLLPSSLLSS